MSSKKIRNEANNLAVRHWDDKSIENRYQQLRKSGIPEKILSAEDLQKNKQEIIDRVELRAQEYNYFTKNCARGTAMSLLEEFGLGNMTVIKSLSAFPGFGATGWMCGAVSGSLIALSLFFGSDDLKDSEAVGKSMAAARTFMERFQAETDSPLCPDLQEQIFGKYMDAGASSENMQRFAEAKGFEKCGACTGFGAKIAAEIIIDSMASEHAE